MDRYLVTVNTDVGTRRYFYKANELSVAKTAAKKDRGMLYDLVMRWRIQ